MIERRRFVGPVLIATALAAVGAATAMWFGVLPGTSALPAPRESVAASGISHEQFTGAATCKECHAAQFTAWENSTHARAGGTPNAARVIAAFNGAPLRFRDATVTPRIENGRYAFVIAQDHEPTLILTVDGVIGGGHMQGGGTQGFVTQRDDGTVRFLPFDWSRQGHGWFCNTNSRANHGWVPITPQLNLADCGDWPPTRVLGDLPRYANCQSCHASQLTVTLDTSSRKWITQASGLEINCESCHGPGKPHIAKLRAGARDGDIGYASLATLSKDGSLATCFQCHAVKDRLRGGFLSGDSLATYYSLQFPALGDRPLTADGRSRTFAYQEGHRYSDCYLNGGMTCTSCHDPHTQNYRDVNGAPLAGRFDDRQCTSCHAAKAATIAAHTHHATQSEGSRCTSCHMPYLQQSETGQGAVRYARSDHSIAIPRPAFDSAQGIRNACLGCHTALGTAALEKQVGVWWGIIKPHKPIIAAQARATEALTADDAWPLLLGFAGDMAGDKHVAARFAGMSRFLERHVRADAALPAGASSRLRELTHHTDVDIRALALATLHLADASNWRTRATLTAALRGAGAHDAGLRARWALALGFMGDKAASAGHADAATVAYRRALEITSADSRIWLNLANATRDGGDAVAAVPFYAKSLELEPAQPIALVNLGIAQSALGDTVSAIGSWKRAAALDPGEALAPYNLANAEFSRGRLDEARTLYARAVALDVSLAPAHFQLARVAILKGDGAGAVLSLRRGLRFDSTNTAAREALQRMQQGPLGGRPLQ